MKLLLAIAAALAASVMAAGAAPSTPPPKSELQALARARFGLKTSSDSKNEDKNHIWEWLNSFCILVRGALQCFKIEGKIPQNPNEDKNSFCILVRGALQCFKIEESEIPELINYNAGLKTSSDSKNEDKNHIWEWLNSFCIVVRGALQCFKIEGKIPQNPNEDKNSFCILVRGALQCVKIEGSEIPKLINYNAVKQEGEDRSVSDVIKGIKGWIDRVVGDLKHWADKHSAEFAEITEEIKKIIALVQSVPQKLQEAVLQILRDTADQSIEGLKKIISQVEKILPHDVTEHMKHLLRKLVQHEGENRSLHDVVKGIKDWIDGAVRDTKDWADKHSADFAKVTEEIKKIIASVQSVPPKLQEDVLKIMQNSADQSIGGLKKIISQLAKILPHDVIDHMMHLLRKLVKREGDDRFFVESHEWDPYPEGQDPREYIKTHGLQHGHKEDKYEESAHPLKYVQHKLQDNHHDHDDHHNHDVHHHHHHHPPPSDVHGHKEDKDEGGARSLTGSKDRRYPGKERPRDPSPVEVADLYGLVAGLEYRAKARLEETGPLLEFLEGLLSSQTENEILKATPALIDLVFKAVDQAKYLHSNTKPGAQKELVSLLHQLAGKLKNQHQQFPKCTGGEGTLCYQVKKYRESLEKSLQLSIAQS